MEELSRTFPTRTSAAIPTQAFPTRSASTTRRPSLLARSLREFARAGWSTSLADAAAPRPTHPRDWPSRREAKPREGSRERGFAYFSGLEPLTLRPETNFTMIGERTNITGSASSRFHQANDYSTALEVARSQVRRRRQHPRREHGRGNDRLRSGHDDVPEPRGDRARPRPHSDHDRQLQVHRHRSRPQVPRKARQSSTRSRSRRARRSSSKQAAPSEALRRRVVVMAFDERARPTPHEPQSRDLRARLPHPRRRGRIRSPPTSSSIPTSSPSPPASRSTTTTRSNFIECVTLIKSSARAHAGQRWRQQPLFSFRGNNRVREAMHSAFLYHAIRSGHGHGHRQRRHAGCLRGHPRRRLLEHVEDVLLNRRPDATERLVNYAEKVKGGRQEERADLAWRDPPVEARLEHALVKGITDFIEATWRRPATSYERPLTSSKARSWPA
jgi:5-methyltetrahydrofolate--homocysteine methyltransferase